MTTAPPQRPEDRPPAQEARERRAHLFVLSQPWLWRNQTPPKVARLPEVRHRPFEQDPWHDAGTARRCCVAIRRHWDASGWHVANATSHQPPKHSRWPGVHHDRGPRFRASPQLADTDVAGGNPAAHLNARLDER